MMLSYKHLITKLNYFHEQVTKKYMIYYLKKLTKILLTILVLNYCNNIILWKFSVSAQEVTLNTNVSICDASNRLHKVFISDTKKVLKINQPI